MTTKRLLQHCQSGLLPLQKKRHALTALTTKMRVELTAEECAGSAKSRLWNAMTATSAQAIPLKAMNASTTRLSPAAATASARSRRKAAPLTAKRPNTPHFQAEHW